MCRFVAFLGAAPLLMSRLLKDPSNSLINQSLYAREDKSRVHADGFGLGWYNHQVANTPAIYRSIQPAWNDFNINHFIDKIESTCFFGHIRAATQGAVTLSNCHPFFDDRYLFMHNGLIDHFDMIKMKIIQTIDAAHYRQVLGQTDSEHVFALIRFYMSKSNGPVTMKSYQQAIRRTIKKIQSWLIDEKQLLLLNLVISDGHRVMVCRYSNQPDRTQLTLYYTNQIALVPGRDQGPSVIIASEKLSDVEKHWDTVPMNHFLYIGEDFKPTLSAIEI